MAKQTIIRFADNELTLLRGSARGKGVQVDLCVREALPEGAMINGLVTVSYTHLPPTATASTAMMTMTTIISMRVNPLLRFTAPPPFPATLWYYCSGKRHKMQWRSEKTGRAAGESAAELTKKIGRAHV